VGLLASYFLTRISEAQKKPGLQFAPDAMEALERYDYPGNVRELENAIEHAVTLSEGQVVRAADLPATVRTPRLLSESTDRHPTANGSVGSSAADRDSWSLEQIEREHIQRVLARHRGNATSAAKQLGISRTTLWRKLRQYGLSRTGT
jgi:DNA-binding NtrC family response regulator